MKPLRKALAAILRLDSSEGWGPFLSVPNTAGQTVNARTAMQAAGVNTRTFEDENAMLDQLVSRSQSAVGRQQAIQAGNEIAAQNVQQLQKLRDLVATQITLQGNYMAQQNERQSVSDASEQQFRSRENTRGHPCAQSAGG